MSYEVRQEKHEHAKKMLTREIDGRYSEVSDQCLLVVSFGWGRETEVKSAAHDYYRKHWDELRLVDTFTQDKYIAFPKERPGSIGKPSYKRIKYIMEFEIKDILIREEFGYLVMEENWTEINEMFGGI